MHWQTLLLWRKNELKVSTFCQNIPREHDHLIIAKTIRVKHAIPTKANSTYGLGMVCVLQPDLYERKFIHVLFQMYFKLYASYLLYKKCAEQFFA